MAFKLRNIDRAIEWALRDEIVRRGLWPDQRAFMLANDEAGFNAALAAMDTKVDVFGVGNFKDREQLRRNNVIIERMAIEDGDIFFSQPFTFKLRPDKTYDKIKSADGTNHVRYRIRFVCDDIGLDRTINEIMIKVFARRTTMFGMNDDLTNMTEPFDIYRYGDVPDLSGNDFIERVFDYQVIDVILQEDEVVDNIPPVTTLEAPIMNPGPAGYDVKYPDIINDIVLQDPDIGMYDYFLHEMLEAFPYLKPFDFIRVYAQQTEGMALKNFVSPGDAINSGLTFTPFKGFNKTAAGQYLNTGWAPQLTNFSYSVFTTDVPVGIFELFGLVNAGTSFYMTSQSDIRMKGNSNALLTVSFVTKPYTMYTINRKNRFSFELWEANRMIGTINTTPTDIPVGSVFELNIGDETETAIGTSVGGGIAFSAAGAALRGSEIELLNVTVRKMLKKVGVIE